MSTNRKPRTAKRNLELLWAPWRSQFVIQGPRRRCIFCAVRRSHRDRENYVIERGRSVFAILNIFPYNNGHLIIAPYRHVAGMDDLSQAEWAETFSMSRRLIKRLRKAIQPQGFNLGMNLGRAAGAGVPGHLHVHIVPRWNGDTNYMPIVSGTKILSQSLDELFTILAEQRRKR